MCLIKIRKDEEEDEHVPYRRVVRSSREHVRTSSPHRRSSKVIAVRTSEPRIVVPAAPRPLPVEAPPGLAVPAPQPVPVFVQPPPAPAPPPQTEVHYVHVSPRSSFSDHHRHSEDDYHYRREVRYERDYSPPRDDYYTYRHTQAPRSRSRHRDRSRSRSRSRYDERDYEEYDDDGRRRTVRVTKRVYRDD